MKKHVQDLNQKSEKEIQKEITGLNNEITKVRLEFKVNPPKDINVIAKKKRQIAVLKTLLTQKKQLSA